MRWSAVYSRLLDLIQQSSGSAYHVIFKGLGPHGRPRALVTDGGASFRGLRRHVYLKCWGNLQMMILCETWDGHFLCQGSSNANRLTAPTVKEFRTTKSSKLVALPCHLNHSFRYSSCCLTRLPAGDHFCLSVLTVDSVLILHEHISASPKNRILRVIEPSSRGSRLRNHKRGFDEGWRRPAFNTKGKWQRHQCCSPWCELV